MHRGDKVRLEGRWWKVKKMAEKNIHPKVQICPEVVIQNRQLTWL